MSRRVPKSVAFLTVIIAGAAGCGGSDPVDPTRGPLEELPVTSATVTAAVELLTTGPLTVPSSCGGSPEINCASGVPGSPMKFSVTRGAVTTTPVATKEFTFSTDLVIASLQDGSITASGVTCGVGVNTAPGASPTVRVSGTATFITSAITGLTSRLQITSTLSGLEDVDITVGGGLTCEVATFFKPLMLSTMADALATGGNVCGAPGPALLKVCSETELQGSRSRF